MKNLLYYLVKWWPWILFAIYVGLSCKLLFNSNPYQHSVYLTSANSIASGIYNVSANVRGYLNLRQINEDLQRRNAELELEALRLNERIISLEEMEIAKNMPADTLFNRYDFVIAHVINNSVNRPRNYITINKGELDGIRPEMGVVDRNGIVGKVNVVGPHSSRVISLLNSHLPISCKIKGTQLVGTLVWDGNDSREALLKELPRHSTFNPGDTIVSSGYSTTFPEGVPVGVILEEKKDYDDNFFTLKIKLFTDFSKLSTVRVVIDNMTEEIKAVEADPDEKTTSRK